MSEQNKQCGPLINKARFARFCGGGGGIAIFFSDLLNNATHNERLACNKPERKNLSISTNFGPMFDPRKYFLSHREFINSGVVVQAERVFFFCCVRTRWYWIFPNMSPRAQHWTLIHETRGIFKVRNLGRVSWVWISFCVLIHISWGGGATVCEVPRYI